LIEDAGVRAFREKLELTGVGYGTSPPQIRADVKRIRNKLTGEGILNKKGGYGVKAAIFNAKRGTL